MIDATAKDMIVGSRFELERGDAYYPQALTEIKKPPEKLYGIGDPKLLSSAPLRSLARVKPPRTDCKQRMIFPSGLPSMMW